MKTFSELLGFDLKRSRMVHDPGSLALIFGAGGGAAAGTAAAGTAAAGAATTGGALSTISSISAIAAPVLGVTQALAANQESKAQAAEFERAGKESQLMASIEAERLRKEGRQRQSAERSAFIEGGAFSGTAAGVLEQNAVAQELDALTVEFQGEQRAAGAEFQASQARRAASPLNVFSAAVEGFSGFDPLNVGN